MIRLLIADDIEQFRNYFINLLSAQNNIELVGVASSGLEAIKLAKELEPDIVLMDIQMESNNAGIMATKEIINHNPLIKIIILTIHDDPQTIKDAFMNGITDYLLKTSSPHEIIASINEAFDENHSKLRINTIIKNEMIRLQKERDDFYQCFKLLSNLSKSEQEILILLCSGKKYREIAEERNIEESTVRSIVSKISKKLEGIPIRNLIQKLNELTFIDIFSDI